MPNEVVTILIVTSNSLPYLELTVRSIGENTKIPYKLLVVDNGSASDTKLYLQKNNIPYLRNPKNVGYIKAQWQGFRKITTKYVCSCNDDIIVTENWLTKLLEIIKTDKRVKIVAPIKWSSRMIYPYDKRRNCRQVWEEIKLKSDGKDLNKLIDKFTLGKRLEIFSEDLKRINGLRNVFVESPPDFVPGFCFLTEKKFWDRHGGFVNTDFKIYGTEDAERCWRLGILGYKIIKTPSVYVHHFEGGSVGLNKVPTNKVLIYNNRILLKKMGKYFWNWLEKEQTIKPLGEIIKDHWFVGELLKNSGHDNIPYEPSN
ncbi:MAG: glycosyltransferase family 2 protein [Patescibacteria group bacterium]|nr:glycosyltransferase family 2 protein [Patescibacteria group bacterium]MCL5432100.1 glycosyltransferase family 2 protein [Patescibacteria group bacterium]